LIFDATQARESGLMVAALKIVRAARVAGARAGNFDFFTFGNENPLISNPSESFILICSPLAKKRVGLDYHAPTRLMCFKAYLLFGTRSSSLTGAETSPGASAACPEFPH
jgi:hypothetical protein